MKNLVLFSGIVLFLFSFHGLCEKPELGNRPAFPVQLNASPIFGKDIFISYNSSQNQRIIKICSAFNGWLYAAYTYKPSWITPQDPLIVILRSTDMGLTWSVLKYLEISTPNPDEIFRCLDIATTGDSISNLKVCLASVASNGFTGNGIGFIKCWNYNMEECESFHQINELVNYMAFATDFPFPATNSNPNSLGVLYSTSAGQKRVIFISSSNGGLSFDNTQIITESPSIIYQKVSLAYGRSPSWSTGRYFAIWEEKDDVSMPYGRIYTAHSDPYFNSPFTTPVNLDGLNPEN
jgi:hypothetical protein